MKVGDRVRIKGEYNIIDGRTGVITYNETKDICTVKVDNWHDGWGEKSSYWNVCIKNLTKIEQPRRIEMKVGDRVIGKFGAGIIIYLDNQYSFLVEHDKETEGLHSGVGKGRENSCWWFSKDEVTKIEKVKQKKEKDLVYILLSFGQNNDRVIEVSKNKKKLERKRLWLEANFADYEFGLIQKELKS